MTHLPLPQSLRILEARNDPGADFAQSAKNGSLGGDTNDPLHQISWFAKLIGSMSVGQTGGTEGMTVYTLLASLVSGAGIFFIEFLLFLLLKGRLRQV